jgi:hypothetical protein
MSNSTFSTAPYSLENNPQSKIDMHSTKPLSSICRPFVLYNAPEETPPKQPTVVGDSTSKKVSQQTETTKQPTDPEE